MIKHVDRAASVMLAGPALSAGVLPSSPGISILMYHSVSDDPEPGVAAYYRLATSPARFRQQMEWLRDEGYLILDLTQALGRLHEGILNNREVVLTFDDGFQDFRQNAWPVLSDFGYCASVFLPTAFIGRTFKGRPCLTWSEIKELRAQGISFGAHTVTHPVLHGLPWTDVTRELTESRATIEDALSEAVTTFAYPYAFPREDRPFAERFRQELASHGFTAAVTTTIGRAKAGGDPLCLKRLPVSDADDRRLFLTKLRGGYDWLGAAQLLVRRAKGLRRFRGSR